METLNQSETSPFLEATGFVLAGGESRRMGQDKAFLKYRGRTLLERAVQTLELLEIPVFIVTSQRLRKKSSDWAPCIVDKISGLGPAGAIWTALATSPSRANFILACDMPAVSADMFKILASAGSVDAALFRDRKGRVQPLCAAYSKNCTPLFRQIAKGGGSTREILSFPDLTHKVFDADASNISPSAFRNLNDPDAQDLKHS